MPWIKVRYGLFNHLGSLQFQTLCNFKLVPQGKTGKERIIKIRVLVKFLANNPDLSDAEDNTSGLLKKRGIADLSLLRTLLAIHRKSWEPSVWKVLNSIVLVAYASLAASRTLLQWLACLNFTLDSADLFCWFKQTKNISMSYSSSIRSWKPWRWERFDPILTMMDIYINCKLNPLTKFTSSSRSTEFKDIQMITKTIPTSVRIFISCAMRQGILFWVYWKVNGNWNNMIRISQWTKSHCRTNTSIRRNK